MDLMQWVGLWLPPFLLVFARTVALFAQAPIIGSRAIPNMVKLLIAFWVSVCYLVTLPAPPTVPDQLLPFFILLVNGVLVGLAFGYAASMMFFAIQGGGELVATQTSLSMMTTLNPLLRTQTSAVGQLFFYVSQLTFVFIGGHLVMLGGFFHTFELIPITGLMYIPGAFSEMLKLTGALFLVTLQMCMPALLVMFFIDFGIGIINKTAQQVSNILEIVMAVKPSVGFVIVLLMMPNVQAKIVDLSDTMVTDVVKLMEAARPPESINSPAPMPSRSPNVGLPPR